MKYLLTSVLFFTAAAHADEPSFDNTSHDLALAEKSEGSPEYPVVRHDLLLSDADCGHASVTLTDRGNLVSGVYAVCGRQTLTFLWRPHEEILTLSASGAARLGHAYVNLAKKTWSADAIFFPILSSSWGREINLITEVLAKARPSLGKSRRSPRSDFQQDPGPGDPWGGDDPDCMGHYMTFQLNECAACLVRWFFADSRIADYSNGYKPAGTSSCGCTKETSCTNL